MKRFSLCSSAIALSALPFVVACGDDGGSGGSGTSTSTVTGPTNSVSSSSTSTSTSTSTSNTSSTSSGMGQCTELTVDDLERIPSTVDPGFFFQQTLDIAGPEEDVFRLEFYGNTASITGTIDLSAAPNTTYETCEVCVLLGQDIMMDTSLTYFFPTAGTLELGATSPPFMAGTLSDVTLIEVTIDPDTFVTTPVQGGACYHITSVPFSFAAPPGTWACDPVYFGTNSADDCDCGCAAADPDCADMTAAVCDYCNLEGSCAEMAADCTPINPTNNAVCM